MNTTRAAPCVLGTVADDLAAAGLFLARRFAAGATMWCCSPAWPHHARHVTVEFVHPVVVGKRALPAVTITDHEVEASMLVAARPGDVLLAVAPGSDPVVAEAFRAAPELGLGTVWIGAGARPAPGSADHVLWVDSDPTVPFDGHLILLYHVLWELTHVCFEHPGMLRGQASGEAGGLRLAASTTSAEHTGFLYPFLDERDDDVEALLVDLARSAEAKAVESHRLRGVTEEKSAEVIDAVSLAMGERLRSGGRLFAFGNGGSSTDAAGLATLFHHPPRGHPFPARSLTADDAVLTALSNDIGYELVFARQLIAHARPGDVAVGISTSGNSANLLAAFAEARRGGLLTVGLAGYDGGAMAAGPDLDHVVVVESQSIHRIQEVQSAVGHELWSRVQAGPEGEAVT